VVAAVAAACARAPDAGKLVPIRRADLVIGVEVTGELAALDSTDIKPPPLGNTWSFKITMLAPEGADVKQGEPVTAFDPSEMMRDLETMKNTADEAQKKLDQKRNAAALSRRDEALDVAEAEAALNKATLETSAPKDLVASIQHATLELDAKAAQLALDRAKNRAEQARRSDAAELDALAKHLDYAKSRVQELESNIGRMTVTAPRGGTVVYPTDWRGEKKKVGDNAWRQQAVLQIVSLGQMIGHGKVDEVDIAKVALHQKVTLRLDALPDVQLHGTISKIARSVEAKAKADPSKVVLVDIALDPTKAPLRPGMRFRGEIETTVVPQVVQVPADAVFVTPSGPVAYRAAGGRLEAVPLVLGRRNAGAIEVKRGLAPGDRVSTIDPTGGGA
jgi:hypothetical protein